MPVATASTWCSITVGMSDRRSLLRVALVLYGFALVTPALVFGDDRLLWGFHCLVWGWIVEPCWLANPLLLAAAVTLSFRWRKIAAVPALAALGLGISTFFVMGDELRYPHVGCVAWLASMLLVLIESLRAPPPDIVVPRAIVRR